MRITHLIRSTAAPPSLAPARVAPSPASTAEPVATAGGDAAPPGSGLEGLLRGRVLGDRYEILEVIGRGAMGVVYRALDQRLEREVAVKVLSAAASGGESYAVLRARFAREARAVAGIRHGNVVAVHDRGTDSDLALDFLVMELLEGEDLGTLVRRLGLPRVSSTVRLLRQAAAGVAAGHRAGLIHRDIKPGNLFLESSGGEVRVKVLDFGIAEAARDPEWTMARDGGETLHALSPAFASPEQLRGDVPLTRASDVFSLGAVGHHLLTGRRLWESLDPHRALQEMEAARTALLQDLALPLKLRETLVRALASHPEDRFRDAGELLIALDAVRASEANELDTDAAAAARPAAQAAPATIVHRPPVPSNRIAAPELGAAVHRLGTAFLLALIASICFLTMLSGDWNIVVAATAIFGAAALLPLPGAGPGAAGSPRFVAMTVATVLLLGLMLTRAAVGSLTGLLVAQIVITAIALWLTSPGRDPAAGEVDPRIREAW